MDTVREYSRGGRYRRLGYGNSGGTHVGLASHTAPHAPADVRWEGCWEQRHGTVNSVQRAGGRGGGWSPVCSCEALPELHTQLPQYESRSLSSGLLSFPLIWHSLPRMDRQQPFLRSCQAPPGCPFTGHWHQALHRHRSALPATAPRGNVCSCPRL